MDILITRFGGISMLDSRIVWGRLSIGGYRYECYKANKC